MTSQRRRGVRAWRGIVVACTVPLSLIAGGITSAAIASAPGPDVAPDVSASATGTLHVGDAFDFTISVTNHGDQTAHDVVLSNDLPTGLAVTGPLVPPFDGGQCSVASSQTPPAPPAYSVYCERAELPVGDTSSATFSVVVTHDIRCGSVTTVVRANADDEPKANRVDNTASDTVSVACTPSMSLAKTGPAFARVGDRVRFTLRAANTGRVPFDHVTVSDPGCDAAPALVADGNGDAVLAPHEIWVFRCDASITPATPRVFTTTARATGRSTSGIARAASRATVRVVHPRVTLAVSATPASGAPGDVITYRYVVRNGGDTVLSNVVVTDDRLGAIGTIAQLSPGHSVTLRATRVLSASGVWVVNTATVVAREPSGRSVSASANASVTTVAAAGDGGRGAGSDGTAFTGADAKMPGILGTFLALLGVILLLAARRRA